MNNDDMTVVGEATVLPKKVWQAPVSQESSGMTFTKDVWEDFSGGNWCFGCTNCNCN